MSMYLGPFKWPNACIWISAVVLMLVLLVLGSFGLDGEWLIGVVLVVVLVIAARARSREFGPSSLDKHDDEQ
jgi:uncharacterized membrane protein YdbT with pleckstrin-like domain